MAVRLTLNHVLNTMNRQALVQMKTNRLLQSRPTCMKIVMSVISNKYIINQENIHSQIIKFECAVECLIEYMHNYYVTCNTL